MNKVLGIGNALVDILTRLESDDILIEFSLPRGSMQLVSLEVSNRLLTSTLGLEKKQSSGGSAANTIHGLANLGIETGFVGKVGKDHLGGLFEKDLLEKNIRALIFYSLEETGRSIALISKDSERTFATYLGAAIDLHEEDITSDLYAGYDYLYLEGYLVQDHELFSKALRLAKTNKLKVALDMASYNVVRDNKDFLYRSISDFVDIVLANEKEASALTGKTPEKALIDIAGITDIAVVKLGQEGSLVKRKEEEYRINIIEANNIDSTGAGDLYAAGFMYGMCMDQPLEKCGHIGTLLGGRITEVIGAKLSEEQWKQVRQQVKKICY
jgi:sugar/nucleoside kinase (ribokinase family)